MKLSNALCIALGLPVLTLGAVVETLKKVPRGWEEVGAPSDDRPIGLQIGLVQSNLDQLHERLYAVSDPDHEHYGKHAQREEVDDMLKPSKEAVDSVVSWLQSAGVEQVETDEHWVSFATTVGKANDLLGTTFKNYRKDGVTRLRTTQYSVPDDVADYVDLITPTTYFGKTHASSPTIELKPDVVRRQAGPACSQTITPKCLNQLYQTGYYKPDPKSGSRIGFGSFLNQSAIYKDLYKFEAMFNIPKQGFSIETTHGGKDNQSASEEDIGEANLDVQTIMGIANPLPITEYITGGVARFIPSLILMNESTNEPYVSYYKYLLSKPNSQLPQVISNSYGEEEQTVPKRFAVRTCNMIAQMGVRGITILESSGDTGVGASCRRNDGSEKEYFNPQFPATCPFVTAVGGTQAVNPEIAWLNGSGGFSDYFPRPYYQDAAINNYFDTQVSPRTLKYIEPYFNMEGRGFPDISAHSLRPNFLVIRKGEIALSGGTSASAPVWAAVVGLLNDARLRAGKPALGFMNPWLYKTAYKGLHDITLGYANGCYGYNAQTGEKVPGAGRIRFATWNATLGWDPVTGLGTPNFTRLKAIALK